MVARTPTGERPAFEAWARARGPKLAGWVRQRGPGLSPEDCEDIASEAMLAVCQLHLRRELDGEPAPDDGEMDRYTNGVIGNCVAETRRPRRRAVLPLRGDEEHPAEPEDLSVEDRRHRDQVHTLIRANRDAMPQVLRETWEKVLAQVTGRGGRSTALSNTERGQLGRLKTWLLRLLQDPEQGPAAAPAKEEDE